MRNEDKLKSIEFSIYGAMVRIYFGDINRSPVYGKFVELPDAEELRQKGFFRFVYGENIENFDTLSDIVKPALTKLYSLNSIEFIKLY